MGKARLKLRKEKNHLMKFLKPLIQKILDNDVAGMAAQLAYFFLLSLFPLLFFVVTLLPFTPLTQHDIFNLIKDVAPAETISMIERTLNEVMQNRSGGLLTIGIIGTLWSASNGMNALMKSLNRAYDVQEKRSFIVARSLAIVFTFAMIFVFILALLLPVFGKQLGIFIFSTFGYSDMFLKVWSVIRWALTPVILFIVFLAIYYIAPSIKIKCLTAVPGAIFSSIGWLIVSLGFSFYISKFANYSATYGSIGGIIILMLWFYITGIIIMVGGEINSLVSQEKDKC
ncbi:YihY/virulence factor BrkB family protein [Lederbergia wuyishanensis]|uniref:Membrane protein n=1 Tax=Lederbergia wuyishanensis TaxID=1347903 RepID=A0ABU0D7J9_9BACI|nr:YihY/virulence factor BrkB family protein [Lederbergia wuyishanensis]MCJ8009066.1 YihY/virulence factor BrkB family protein [Lederbergia wuyishanensis]MDQ0344402.1 membrane protein [Lederbergia wuyishanensis]